MKEGRSRVFSGCAVPPFLHSTNIYQAPTISPATVPGAGDTMVSKIHMFPALMELRVQWENTDCKEIVTKGTMCLQCVVCLVKGST